MDETTEQTTGQSPGQQTGQQTGQQGPAPDGPHLQNVRDLEGLRRSTSDRMIAGVAGGLGRHLGIDPAIVRVTLVVLAFFGGAGLLLYGAAWLLVPEDGQAEAPIRTTPSTRTALLIGVGVLAALLLVGDGLGGVGFPWPLVLVALGVVAWLVTRDQQQRPTTGAPADMGSSGATGPGGVPPYVPFTPQYAPYGSPPPGTPVYGAAPRPNRGPLLFGPTLALLALALGGLGLYDTAGYAVADAAYPALALAVIGGMLVLGSFFGRPGGLVLLGVLAALVLAGTSIGQPGYDGDRNLELAPTTAAGVEPAYDVPAGRIELDLRAVEDLEALDGRRIALEAQAGELVVILPDGVTADVDADIRLAGAIDLPGRTDDGMGVTVDRTVGSGDTRIDLELDLLAGHIEVRQ